MTGDISLAISGIALVVTFVGLLLERRSRVRADALLRHEAVEQARARILVETHKVEVADGFHAITATVLNAGPSVAREVDLDVREETTGEAISFAVAETEVSRALMAGDQRTVTLQISSDVARSQDLFMHLIWIDGNGAHDELNVIFLKGDGAQGVPFSDWAAGLESWSTVPPA